MKKLIKNSAKYLFTIITLAAIILVVNFKMLPNYFQSALYLKSNWTTTINPAVTGLDDLPCGFVAHNLQQPAKSSFGTNSLPILQYPAGTYPGSSNPIPDALYSELQHDQLILQADGNLVIYCTTCTPAKALWSTQTNGKGGKTLFFQPDGDLVLRNASGKMIWHSNIHSTCKGSEQAYYTLQDDGNLVMLYDEVIANANAAPGAQPNIITAYLGGTASTNDQASSPHPGKIQ